MNRTFAIVALSVVGGVALALLFLTYGVPTVPVLILAILAATRLDRPALAIGAQLFGIGATITWLMVPWTVRCAGVETGACASSPGTGAWFFMGVAIAAGGAFMAAKSAAT